MFRCKGLAVFGNNVFVAVAGFGVNEIWRSVNGTDWAQIASPVSTIFNQVRFINNRFVVVGHANTIIASTHGAAWDIWLDNNAADILLDKRDGILNYPDALADTVNVVVR